MFNLGYDTKFTIFLSNNTQLNYAYESLCQLHPMTRLQIAQHNPNYKTQTKIATSLINQLQVNPDNSPMVMEKDTTKTPNAFNGNSDATKDITPLGALAGPSDSDQKEDLFDLFVDKVTLKKFRCSYKDCRKTFDSPTLLFSHTLHHVSANDVCVLNRKKTLRCQVSDRFLLFSK